MAFIVNQGYKPGHHFSLFPMKFFTINSLNGYLKVNHQRYITIFPIRDDTRCT